MYRVFIGPPGRRVFHANARTKRDAIRALFLHIDAMRPYDPDAPRHEATLLADKDRILRERFRPMPSGLHGPLYSADFGSICN